MGRDILRSLLVNWGLCDLLQFVCICKVRWLVPVGLAHPGNSRGNRSWVKARLWRGRVCWRQTLKPRTSHRTGIAFIVLSLDHSLSGIWEIGPTTSHQSSLHFRLRTVSSRHLQALERTARETSSPAWKMNRRVWNTSWK